MINRLAFPYLCYLELAILTASADVAIEKKKAFKNLEHPPSLEWANASRQDMISLIIFITSLNINVVILQLCFTDIFQMLLKFWAKL